MTLYLTLLWEGRVHEEVILFGGGLHVRSLSFKGYGPFHDRARFTQCYSDIEEWNGRVCHGRISFIAREHSGG